jgi:hypothetical protein
LKSIQTEDGTAYQLIEDANYGPEASKAIRQAFDEAWLVIARNFSEDTAEAARGRLANALLALANEGSRDVEALKRRALQAMALSYHADPHDRG